MNHDPNSLADELDRLASQPSSSAGAPDDPLVQAAERLRKAPHPSLSPEASARIRSTMLAAVPQNAPTPLVRRLSFRMASVAAMLIVFVAGALLSAQIAARLNEAPPALLATTDAPLSTVAPTGTGAPQSPPAIQVTPQATIPPTVPPTVQVTVPPTVQATVQATAQPTVPPTVQATVQPTVPPTVPPTVQATTAPALPSMTPTRVTEMIVTVLPLETTLPITLIVEGPIQAIEENTLTIFDLTIVLDPTDPALSAVQIGDLLRVEGNYDAGDSAVTAVRVVIIDEDVNLNPTDGAVWRDPGDCSNSPPAWAPATGWRRRCQGGANPGGSGNPGSGGGGNSGDDDDDDDDD